MRQVLSACAIALFAAASVSAQDATIRTEKKIDADDAKVRTFSGCLTGGPTKFTLTNVEAVPPPGKTSDKPVGTSGRAVAYVLTAPEGVTFVPHVGQKVEVSGVLVPPAKDGDKDADVEIRERTEIEREGAPDSESETRTRARIPRGSTEQFAVASIKMISPVCLQ
jgi:hypothetical protein